jgi:hypothetical protein
MTQHGWLSPSHRAFWPLFIFFVTPVHGQNCSGDAWWLQHYQSGAADFFDVANNGSRFVLVGLNANTHQNTLWTSEDGLTWTPRNPNLSQYRNLLGVDSDGSQFVVSGSGGVIITSSDGIVWTTRDSGISSGDLETAWLASQPVRTASRGRPMTPPLCPALWE